MLEQNMRKFLTTIRYEKYYCRRLCGNMKTMQEGPWKPEATWIFMESLLSGIHVNFTLTGSQPLFCEALLSSGCFFKTILRPGIGATCPKAARIAIVVRRS